MGTRGRPRPERLAGKLLEIREKLGLSQNGMIRRMGLQDRLVQAEVSAYELGLREPPLYVLLEYARAARILVEWLIDDDVDLPEELPATPLPGWVRRPRRAAARRGPSRSSRR
jgi:transcriptional regulator with XRE-family HTH domain